MNRLLGMYGMIWTQLISELLVLSASFIIYFKTVQRFESGAAAAQEDAERRPQDVIK